MTTDTTNSKNGGIDLDVIVVGGGISGLYSLYKLRELGLTARAFEAGSGLGGTWYWNRYPGCRCDIESLEYSFSFSPELEQEWHWPDRYGTQPQILEYLEHVADRFDLRKDVTLNTRIVSANFDSAANAWTVTTDQGESLKARYVIMATGNLSTPRVPDYEGLESFKGDWYHTRPVAARGRRLHRPAGRRHRHRLVGRAEHPVHRLAGKAPLRLPAHRPVHPAGARRADGPGEGAPAQGRVPRAPQGRLRHAVRHRGPPAAGQGRPGRDAGRARRRLRREVGDRRQHQLPLRLQRPAGQRVIERDRGGVRARNDPRHREGPRGWPSCSAPRTTRSAPSA